MFSKNSLSKALLISVSLASMSVLAEPTASLKEKMSKIGTIKKILATDSKGIYAWIFEKNGKTLVLYNTPDENYFIKGTIYDINSKKVISNKYIESALQYSSPEFKDKVLSQNKIKETPNYVEASKELTAGGIASGNLTSKGVMNLKWQGKQIPQALKLLDSLAGAKQGKGSPQDTLYVFYDPRCPWCHRTFTALQPYVYAKYTVKWIPTVALGKTDDALKLASAPLQNSKLLTASFEKEAAAKNITPTKANINSLNQNLQYLVAYFKVVEPNQAVSVPFGVMLDKSTGKLTHIQGLTEKPILDLVFGTQ